jgi:hypothetical protein
LRGLSFQTVALASGAAENPKFQLDVTDTTSGLTTTGIFSVLSRGPTPTPVPPYIAGTQSWPPILPGSVIDPFASVTVSDANKPDPVDSAKITLKDASGNATDANGTLTGSGTSLTEPAAGSGVYTLAATDPSTLTTELDSLTFHPTGLPSGVTSETTHLTLDVSDPTFSTTATDPNTTVTVTAPTKVCFLVHDNTTGQSTQETGTPYTGPTAGLTREFINLTHDNLDIASICPNCFIYSGGGNDSINVSQGGGNKILDASGGSNFLVGGGGNDTFFLNDLYSTTPIWSTLLNFHAGDAATIWGVTPADFSISWMDGEGAGGSGYTGLTMHVTAAGKPAELLTLVGMTTADLSNGHLAVQFGAVNGTNYMEINHL